MTKLYLNASNPSFKHTDRGGDRGCICMGEDFREFCWCGYHTVARRTVTNSSVF